MRGDAAEAGGVRCDGVGEGREYRGDVRPAPGMGRVVGKDKAFWARGHCVSTVGSSGEAVRHYVVEQEDGSRFEWGEARARPFRGVSAGCQGIRGFSCNR